jgi:hypothetical protein
MTERYKLQIRWEAFNALNTPYFGAPTGLTFANQNALVGNSGRAGEIRSIQTPMRIMQFGLKFFF